MMGLPDRRHHRRGFTVWGIERGGEGEAEMAESGKERVGLGLEWAHFWGLQKAVLWAQVYVIVLPLIKKNLGTMLFLAL